MEKILDTLLSVGIAVGASAALWVAANLLFNQVTTNWRRFNTAAGATIGFLLMVVLDGNRLLRSLGPGSDTIGTIPAFLWTPFIGAIVVGVIAGYLSSVDDPGRRLLISVASFGLLGVVIGLLLEDAYKPSFDHVALVGWTVGLVAVGAVLSALRERPPLSGALIGGALGWIVGSFGSATLGTGSTAEAVIGAAVPAAALGWRFGRTPNADDATRGRIDNGSRAFIFLAPALVFIAVTLVVPTIRTIYLSLLDRDSEDFIGFDNYQSVFTDVDSFDVGSWTNIFTSRLFLIGMVILAFALAVAWFGRKSSGKAFEVGGPAIGPLVIAIFLLVFAVFSVLRGTIMNNLWWVFTVTLMSTALGLAIAVLADRGRFESVAKSIIFMPMAVSLVGASIIWRFMFVARNENKPQTGVLNAIWVGLGRLSTGNGLPTLLFGAAMAAIGLGFLALLAKSLVRRQWNRIPLLGLAFAGMSWFLIRFYSSGVGGIRTNASGELKANPILFVQEPPFNNVWLMVILIWIETGFAMVILSAAIKAIPSELIEAARVDGADDSQIFWRVTLPQIATTIGVVVTTLIVLVMKVFDIVKVVTNGNFGTQVLANDMFQVAFSFTDTGRGAALAVILFLSVLPVMYFNIRRMQREEV